MQMQLKNFQEKTANRIFELYQAGKNRVLLADEVGLGKTIIARRIVELIGDWHLKGGDDQFRVVYVCSNINIAKQNSCKLGIKNELNISNSRLTMQHLLYYNKTIKDQQQILIPLTPSTSFKMQDSPGNADERALIYVLLSDFLELDEQKKEVFSKIMMMNVEKIQNWQEKINYYKKEVERCGDEYSKYINEQLCNYLTIDFQDKIKDSVSVLTPESKKNFKDLLKEIRTAFARISVDTIKPDLVIMDEFQRFTELIDSKDPELKVLCEAFLGEKVIDSNYINNTKVLLLSATPYKPYSTIEEISEDPDNTHYKDFMRVMDFLKAKPEQRELFHKTWQDYSNSLIEINLDNYSVFIAKKDKAENELYNNICRTERYNTGIIDDSSTKTFLNISDGDVFSYIHIQKVIDLIKKEDNSAIKYSKIPIDYVKSSPYLLSFMDKYKIRKQINDYCLKSNNVSIINEKSKKKYYLFLRRDAINNYNDVPFNNARLEKLNDVIFGDTNKEVEKLLWVPASKPYYNANGIFEKNKNFSKLLVFSSWEMVPRMIATMMSYQAEKKTLGKLLKNSNDSKRGKRYFSIQDSSANFEKETKRYGVARLKNETKEILCYISEKLANLYNPKEYYDKGIKELKDIEKSLLSEVKVIVGELSVRYNLRETNQFWAKDIIDFLKLIDGENINIQVYPKDIESFLVKLIIGSPAFCLYRTLHDKEKSYNISSNMFIPLFNKAESASVIDLIYNDDEYYYNVLKYCCSGNLQAVIDEFYHTLDDKDNVGKDFIESIINTTNLQVDTYESFIDKRQKKMSMRTHFAVGYFNTKTDEKNANRVDNIRKAFNSPFRPFILATTSIGQEGLDFHKYCRKIMHWNLPSNPVDLEQREGRVNRFECLAVRQNIAKKYENIYSWDGMFKQACNDKEPNSSDLIPFWCFDKKDNPIKIERIIPMYPYSSDCLKYERLKNVLSLYRLTLGQPSQEELIDMFKNLDDSIKVNDLCINLSPFDKS